MFKTNAGKNRIVAMGVVAVAVVALFIGVSTATKYRDYKNKVAEITFSDVNIGAVADGVYLGEYNVDVIYAKVEVTVQGGRIVGIQLLEHRHERGEKAEAIVDDIVAEQRVDVDAIASATNSSKVIKKAVENALTQK